MSGLEFERMTRVDGCPECVQNYETPRHVQPDGPEHFVAHYECSDCEHAWTTSWRDR